MIFLCYNIFIADKQQTYSYCFSMNYSKILKITKYIVGT